MEDYAYTLLTVATPEHTVALDANVATLVNALRAGLISGYGDFGGPFVYWFDVMNNGLGNIIYTVFDRATDMGMASFMVRYGAASTVKQVISEPYPRSSIQLQHLVLPAVPAPRPTPGRVIP